MEGTDIIRSKFGLWIGLVIILVLGIHCSVLADSAGKPEPDPGITTSDNGAKQNTVKLENEEMVLEAAELNLVGDGLIEASGNVELTMKKNELRFETSQLSYDSVSGVITAPKTIKVINSQAVLEIDSLTYNLKNNTGSGGALEGTITKTGDGRDTHVSGKTIEISQKGEVMTNTTVTRCPQLNPHYVLKAKRITLEGKSIRLSSVVLYIKGIPVFYLSQYTLHTDHKRDFPEVQLSYDNTKGIILKEQSTSAINDRLDFRTDISVETLGKSNVSVGLGYQFNKSLADHLFINTDLKGSWTVGDMVTYNTPGYLVVADGLVPLSVDNERQYGISVTRKYWQGFGGRWQVGVLARSVSKLDSTTVDPNDEYGGTYAGYQIDYKPADNLTLSLLRLDSYGGSGLYKDFEVYTGTNLMYNWTIPLNPSFDLNLSGRYNFSGTNYLSSVYYDNPQYWIRQKYDLVYNTCCWSVNLGWDQVYQSWNFGVVFMF
jgi:hypothetical protein